MQLQQPRKPVGLSADRRTERHPKQTIHPRRSTARLPQSGAPVCRTRGSAVPVEPKGLRPHGASHFPRRRRAVERFVMCRPLLTPSDHPGPPFTRKRRCWCVLSVSWRGRSPPKEGSYQHFCREKQVSGGGGSRTRVPRCLDGTSPSASGGGVSGPATPPAPVRNPSRLRCP